MPRRIELFYKDALDNLMFIKQQQWAVTRYALTAYVALFASARLWPQNCRTRSFYSSPSG
jgi:hypothetical protein